MKFTLNSEDVRLLKSIIRNVRNRPFNTRQLPVSRIDLDDVQPPERLMAKTPPGGIPAMTHSMLAGTTEYIPGSADCDLYFVEYVNDLPTLSPFEDKTHLVYNFNCNPVSSDTWVMIGRLKGGEWCVLEEYVCNVYTGTGTGTDLPSFPNGLYLLSNVCPTVRTFNAGPGVYLRERLGNVTLGIGSYTGTGSGTDIDSFEYIESLRIERQFVAFPSNVNIGQTHCIDNPNDCCDEALFTERSLTGTLTVTADPDNPGYITYPQSGTGLGSGTVYIPVIVTVEYPGVPVTATGTGTLTGIVVQDPNGPDTVNTQLTLDLDWPGYGTDTVTLVVTGEIGYPVTGTGDPYPNEWTFLLTDTISGGGTATGTFTITDEQTGTGTSGTDTILIIGGSVSGPATGLLVADPNGPIEWTGLVLTGTTPTTFFVTDWPIYDFLTQQLVGYLTGTVTADIDPDPEDTTTFFTISNGTLEGTLFSVDQENLGGVVGILEGTIHLSITGTGTTSNQGFFVGNAGLIYGVATESVPTVQVDCCPEPMNQTLTLTISGEGSHTMTWDGTRWKTGIVTLSCGGTTNIIMDCLGTGEFEFNTTTDDGPIDCGPLSKPIGNPSKTCDPLEITQSGIQFGLGVGCGCNSVYTFTVTE